MPKIINEYAGNPLGDMLKGIADSFGKNTPQMEMARQKALGLHRENTNIPLLAEATVAGNKNDMARFGILSGQDPKFTGGYGQFADVNRYGPGSRQALTATMAVPGANYGNTVPGVNAELANRRAIAQMTTDRQLAHDMRKFDNTFETVKGPDGRPMLVPRSQAAGREPLVPLSQVQGGILQQDMPNLTPEQRARAGGYEPKLPGNLWVGRTAAGDLHPTADGKTSIQTGEPIVGPVQKMEGPNTSDALRPGVESDLQKNNISYQKFASLLQMTRDVAQRDPMNFGVAGYVKGLLQDTRELGQNVATGLGYNGIAEAAADVQARAARSGVNPALLGGVFDPTLSELHTLADIVVYSAAEALAGQSGREVSDRDVQLFKGVAGDPRAWLMSQDKYMAKLTQMERILANFRQVNERNLPANRRPGGAAAPAGPAPAQPGAPSQVPVYDIHGNRVQ